MVRLDAWIEDLMLDINNMSPIKDGDEKRLMDYYVMLQSHIGDARNARLLGMLPTQMVLPLPTWEKRIWRKTQGKLPAKDKAWAMADFVEERAGVCHQHGYYERATGAAQANPSAQVAEIATKSRSTDRKKGRFPPPKAWDPEAKWNKKWVMFQGSGGKHSPQGVTPSRSCLHRRG
jgi:hypothetical protein